jgi:SpoVK/Ycf46/Vps4 family AAA+-type ATPase
VAPDPSLLRVLDAAVAADPSNPAIRVHLASLLLDADRPGEALSHLQLILASQPDHIEALALAARAALTSGDTDLAERWQRLHDALVAGTLTQPQKDSSLASSSNAPGDTEEPLRPSEMAAPSDGLLSSGQDWDAELLELLDKEQAGRVTLADVAGLDDVKSRLEASFLGPLRNPELRKRYGATLRGGLLLWGPPGCGKTFLARAVAGELGAHFISVGLHDVLDMWLGSSERRLHELFELARKRTPTVLFFDEIDAIAQSRVNLSRSAGRNVVAQLLAEMDGVNEANEGLFLIGATNQPWDVDPAFRRPGRLDHTMLVLPPDGPARQAILEYHLRDRPMTTEPLSGIVAETDGFSGADLRLICEEAAQRALADAVRTGVAQPITLVDLEAAARGIHASTGPWFETARNFVTYANASGDYDELATYLRGKRRGNR